MIAVDTNILVYAHRTDSPFYAKAKEALNNLISGTAAWCIPWSCVHEFYAVVTHPRIYNPPTPITTATAQIESCLESPSLKLIGETPDYWTILKRIFKKSQIKGPQIHDARIVAICLANGIETLWSADRDFSRFEGLTVENPLKT